MNERPNEREDGQEPHLIKKEDINKVKEEDTQFSLTPAHVKSEDDETTSSLTQHIKTEAAGDNCGGPEPASNLDTLLHPDHQRSLCSDSDTDDSEDWRETSHTRSRSNSEENPKVHISEKKDDADHKSPICSGYEWNGSSKSGLTKHTISLCFAQKERLKEHTKIHTDGKKPLSCAQCGKSFTQQCNLTAHLRIHTGEKPFSCSQCGKCFRKSGNMKRHVKIHTGEKPFICSQCGTAFTESGALKNHMRIHSGEKPFICSQCGNCYTRRQGLNDHMRIHTGEKPFSCSQCGKSFMQKGSLKTHMRIHNGEKPSAALSVVISLHTKREPAEPHESS